MNMGLPSKPKNLFVYCVEWVFSCLCVAFGNPFNPRLPATYPPAEGLFLKLVSHTTTHTSKIWE